MSSAETRSKYYYKICTKCKENSEHSSTGKHCRNCVKQYHYERNKRVLNNDIDYYKICNNCKIEKIHSPKGIWCKECMKIHQQKYLSNLKEKGLTRGYLERMKESGELYSYYRKHNLKKKYNLSVSEYNEMLNSQDNKCAICKSDKAFGHSIHFHVDHDHLTNEVRGLLCAKCNSGLGHFKDNETALQNAIYYLQIHKLKNEL